MPTYNIPLRKEVLKTPRYMRAKKAVSAVKAFVLKHSKASEIKLGRHLNTHLWKNGMKGVPRMVKVDAEKDDKGVVKVELFGAPKDEPKKEAPKKEKKAAAAAEVKEKGKEAKEIATAAAKKEDKEKGSPAATTAATAAATAKGEETKTDDSRGNNGKTTAAPSGK